MKPRKTKPPLERLMRFIDVRGHSDCWPWTGNVGTWGYGSFYLDGKNLNASRAAYLLLVGPVESDKVVCHSCDTPACCNPAHLWLGTQAQNLEDCRRKGRSRGQFAEGHKPLGRAMTAEQREEARRLHYKMGMTQTAIARLMGFHSSVISRNVRKQA